ncbi:hypothetical protein ABZS96_20865 [Streptomyces avermitilis]|uniref:hypothetical protein n=1 Tax=Streptomyces avermitilis TaxID=33903 RepID=UPI0033B50C70
MNDPVTQGARAAAQRLTTPAHPNLLHEVEAALHDRNTSRRPDLYTDPTALASLIVSIATLAWAVYNDIRSRSSTAPTPDTVARRVRHQLDQADTPTPPLDPDERDRIIDTTVEETLSAAPEPDAEHP